MDRRGVAAIEFALIGGVLFTMMVGIMEIGRYFATQQALYNASSEALRQWQIQLGATIPISITACNNLLAPDYGTVPLLNSASISFSGRACALQSDGSMRVSATFTYPFTFVAPLLIPALSPAANKTISVFNVIQF